MSIKSDAVKKAAAAARRSHAKVIALAQKQADEDARAAAQASAEALEAAERLEIEAENERLNAPQGLWARLTTWLRP